MEMTGSRRRGIAVLALMGSLILSGSWAAAARAVQDDLRALLPAGGDARGWVKDGDPQEFVGEDLYTYINGGAEIYQEYGFRRVVVQDYENAAGKSVSLEIFEMETPAAAFGIFTFKRSGQGKSIAVGAELEDYYLNFWKGRFLVTDRLRRQARNDRGPPGRRRRSTRGSPERRSPDLSRPLPEPELAGSAILQRPPRPQQRHSFSDCPRPRFHRSRRDYSNGATLIVMDYGSAEARASAWNELRGFLEGSDRFVRTGSEQGAPPLFRDAKGRYLAFAAAGPRLLLGISPDPSASIAMVGQSR
jgi:hypothetical protein